MSLGDKRSLAELKERLAQARRRAVVRRPNETQEVAEALHRQEIVQLENSIQHKMKHDPDLATERRHKENKRIAIAGIVVVALVTIGVAWVQFRYGKSPSGLSSIKQPIESSLHIQPTPPTQSPKAEQALPAMIARQDTPTTTPTPPLSPTVTPAPMKWPPPAP